MLTRRPRKRRWGNELERARRARLADFEMRSEPSPDALPESSIAGTPIRYIAIHCFADEPCPPPAFASEPGEPVVHGQKVDAYVSDGRDVYFAQIETARSDVRAASLAASWWHDHPPRLHVHVFVDAREIARGLFESILVAIATHEALRTRIGFSRSWKVIPLAVTTE